MPALVAKMEGDTSGFVRALRLKVVGSVETGQAANED